MKTGGWTFAGMLAGIMALVAVGLVGRAAGQEAGAVQVAQQGNSIILDNGIVGLTIDKPRGLVSSIRYRVNGRMMEMGNGYNAVMYDYDAGNPSGVGTQHAVPHDPAMSRLIRSTPDEAEVMVGSGPTPVCPFHSQMHIILRRGDAGFYLWLQYVHTDQDPATIMEQTRVVIRPIRGTSVFTNYVVDDARTGPFPSGRILDTVFDTTWVYAFDGIAHSKYETVNYVGDDLVHGMAGHGLGIWLVQPSREYVNGGPLRQELTVHQDSPTQPDQNNILLWMLQGNHFGGPRITLADKQMWSRFYGPAFVYMNQAPTVAALWSDAKKKAAVEDAKWPYDFIHNYDYPLARGTVTGRVMLTDGRSPAGAWVVLTMPGEKDWCMSANGYEFWTKTDADGNFTIPKVRPGEYKLFVSGADQFEDFTHDHVTVAADQTTDLGVLPWKTLNHGNKLWEIGVADRSSGEFRNGDDCRHFDNDVRYTKAFPNDVTFTIGKSKTSQDWNFAQWGWYVKQPYWKVLFDEPAQQSGTATLALGFAAFDYVPGLQCWLNGRNIGPVIHFPKTGMAAYRCGRQDSQYHVAYVTFDASLIKRGSNELRLILPQAVPYAGHENIAPNVLGEVMYDALRLEVDPNSAPLGMYFDGFF